MRRPDTAGLSLAMPEVLPLASNGEIAPLMDGFSSQVFKAGDYVLKLTKFTGIPEAALGHARILLWEHEQHAEYMEGYVPPTMVEVVPADVKGDLAKVLTVQPFIKGVFVGEILRDPNADKTDLIWFFRRALNMYDKTGIMPDVAHIQHGFRVSHTSNIIVNRHDFHPTLVDTNRGRTQRKPGIGKLFSAAIAHAANNTLMKLEE